ncbi:S-norcoclaurine synthase 1 [Linum perenne]
MFNILVLNPRMIVMYPSGTYTLNSILIKFPSMGLTHQIPVIDMIKLAGGGGDDADEESAKLHSACKDWGFFQVINHYVKDEVIQKMKVDLQEFFNQPLQEKMQYAQLPNRRIRPSVCCIGRTEA